MNIQNPYSQKRYSTKEKFQRRLSKLLIKSINKIPALNEAGHLNRIKLSLNYDFSKSETVAPPDDVSLNLLSVNVSELIPIENTLLLKKGFKKLLKKHKPKRILVANDATSIDRFCEKASSRLNPGTWFRLGLIEFNENLPIGKYVDHIDIYGMHLSSSLIMLHFNITPSDSYKRDLEELIKKDFKGKRILKTKIMNPLKKASIYTNSSVNTKKEYIDDLLVELKWRALNYINKFFPLYFHTNSVIAPSVETYKVNELLCHLQRNSKDKKHNFFYRSVGLSRDDNLFHEISKDGIWQLLFNEESGELHNPVKLLCNSYFQPNQYLANPVNHQIEIEAFENSIMILPILTIRKYLEFQTEQLAKYRNKIYKYIQNKRINYKKLLYLRIELGQSIQILTRIKNEQKNRSYIFEQLNLTEMEPCPKFKNQPTWSEYIVDSTEKLITDTYDHASGIVKILDDSIEILDIKANFSMQKKSAWLTFSSLLVAVLSLLIAFISVYFTYVQLEKKPGHLFQIIETIFN
ncbi:hypothetical protein ABHN09_02165 [Bacillus paramobilis]|uniref:hypothetical protein n=1 Tax=Bacillus paramobilis TaxID=2817477 RepID=UPI003D1AAAD8